MGQVPDPRDLEERIGWIKASISSRVSELGRRVDRVRSIADLNEAVGQHPWAAVGAAFAAGLVVAAVRAPREGPRRDSFVGASLRGMLISLVASYGKKVAQHWIDERLHERELAEGRDVRAPAHTVPRTPSRDTH